MGTTALALKSRADDQFMDVKVRIRGDLLGVIEKISAARRINRSTIVGTLIADRLAHLDDPRELHEVMVLLGVETREQMEAKLRRAAKVPGAYHSQVRAGPRTPQWSGLYG